MDILKALEEKAFWGYEFLTWLWFRSETCGEDLGLAGYPGLTVWIEEHLVLEGPDSGSRENTLKEGDVASSFEAAAALLVGKKVKRARFGMREGENTWSFTLDGATLDFKSVKIPHVEAEEEDADAPEAIVFLRMGMVRKCVDAIDALLAEFAKQRVSPDWERATVPEIRKWIEEKAER